MERVKSFVYFSLLLLSALMLSCNDDKDSLAPSGILYLNVEEDATLLTKAQTDVTFESLRVDILKGEKDTIKSYDNYLTDVKDHRLVLPVGTYTIAVRSNHDGEAGWETPLYVGQEEVEVKQGEITSTKVICKIANTKVSVEYSEAVKEAFINYETTVGNESSGSLVFTKDEYRSGYFTPEKLNVNLMLVNREGNEFNLTQVYPDIKPQYHYVLKFVLGQDGDNDEAGADVDVKVDSVHQEVVYNIIINKSDAPFGKGEPRLRLEGEFKDNFLSFTKKADAIIPEASLKLSVPNGIQFIQVKASSQQYADLSMFDETTWLKAVERGFPLIDLNQFEQVLDFGSLINFLQPEGTKVAVHKFTLTVIDKLYQEQAISFTIEIKADVPVNFGTPIVWAKFATLVGESGDLDDVSFRFRKKESSEYQTIKDVEKDLASNSFTALVTSLEPKTNYQYQVVSGENESDWCDFTTDDTPIVPNLSFDDWCKSGKSWMPNAEGAATTWDSGNKGTNTNPLATSNPTSPENSYVAVKGDNKNAVKMKADVVFGMYAAGNIYTGTFGKVQGTSGATLNFGTPYVGRPTKLTGFYQYHSGTVNNGDYNNMSGKPDECSIYIALFDWTAPFVVNTSTGTFVNLNPEMNSSLIALGEFASSKNVEEYTPLTIDIKYYRDMKPSYILIVASASKYGDYFTGSTESILYIDEFELGFDYNENSFNK